MSDGALIHEQVELYLADKPEYRRQIRRTGDGEYTINGVDVLVGFCRQGFLVVHDGPLRQPFTDYVERKESTAIYCKAGLKNSSLNAVAKETRISFGDEGNRYSRLDAMKVAKEQAIFREKAATYTKEGHMVPSDLREKYEKTMDIKLGKRRAGAQYSSEDARRWAGAPSGPPAAPQPAVQEQPTAKAPEHTGPAWWPGGPGPTRANDVPPPKPQPPQPQAPQPQATQVPQAPQAPQAPQRQAPQPQAPPPAPMAPASGAQEGNLFGNVPDLFQMMAARTQSQPQQPQLNRSMMAPPGSVLSRPGSASPAFPLFQGGAFQAPMSQMVCSR